MKELSVEEKAKRYDKAVINGSRLWECGNITRENYEYIFPELEESEDEKIRKELLNHLREVASGKSLELSTTDYERWATWVEKQGKIIKEWSEMKFNNIQTELQEMVDLKLKTEQGEQKSIIDIGKMVDEFAHTEVKGYGMPAMIEVDAYRKGVNDALCLLLDLEKQGEQKPAWSEEDKKMSRFIGNAITADDAYTYLKDKGIELIDAHVWLYELKERIQPQNRWKPSDEQMTALYDSIPENVKNISEREMLLNELYKDLRKVYYDKL